MDIFVIKRTCAFCQREYKDLVIDKRISHPNICYCCRKRIISEMEDTNKQKRTVNCRNLYSSGAAEAYAASVNLLAVEFLVKKNDPESYSKYINIFYTLTDEDLDELDFILSLNRHISTVGAMITQGDYDSLLDILIEYLEEKEDEK